VARGTDPQDRANTGGNHGGMHWYYDGQHKLIYVRRDPAHDFQHPQLFDQHIDPHEDHPIGDQTALDRVHRAALEFLEKTHIQSGEGDGVSADQLKLLREMGYLE
jgi:hypothetical protein